VDLNSYFDPIDYIKVAPSWSFLLILIAVGFVLGVMYARLFAMIATDLFRSLRIQDSLQRILERFQSSGKTEPLIPRGSAGLLSIATLIIFLLIAISVFSGSHSYITLRHSAISSVFRKGFLLPEKGRIINQTGRYVLLLVGSHFVEAIPQTEVAKIISPPDPERTPRSATPGKK
jgi:hypothetical protein